MNGKYSLPVVKAVDMIWTSFDKEEIRRGYAMLMQAAQKGDADALCFIARCFMGEEYVWSGAGFATDDDNASKLMQKSALMGSATGVLCAVRSGNLTPSVERGMPFASFKEAFEEILEQAERGNAFCCYMIGNVYYWGDYLLVEPELAKQFKTENKYNAWAYPIAKEWYERVKNASEPPFFSPPPLFSEANRVAAVSEAAARSGIYFRWMGLMRLEYSTSVKFTIRKPQLFGNLPLFLFLQY